jgi:hypothetical protein
MQVATKENKLCPSTPQLQKDDKDPQQIEIKKKNFIENKKTKGKKLLD